MLHHTKLFIRTPLLLSHPLSHLTGKNIFLKLEAMQPSGAFKDRGIGTLCQYYANKKTKGFIASSGGNAGLAVAYASGKLNIPAKIIIPVTTPTILVDKLKAEKVEVIVEGENWDATDKIVQEIAQSENLSYIPPFNHPLIWQGYESIIEEFKADEIKPDAFIVSVGGGGLLTGLLQGLYKIGWQDVSMITAETIGAASLATAMKEKKRIKLGKIDTIATTLGAKQICEAAFEWTQKHPIFPQVVSDAEAVAACLRFADDHRILVEPACGAALALIYNNQEALAPFKNIAVIICGGNGVSLSLLQKWKTQFGIA